MLVPTLTVERWTTGEHEVDLSEETRFTDAEFRRSRAKVGEVVHRVVDRQSRSCSRGLGAERHRGVVPVDGIRSRRNYRFDHLRYLAVDVIPKPILTGRHGEKRGHYSHPMITPDPKIYARGMVLWL